jgi:hypothetical protein
MNCMICGRETRESDPEWGPYCSESHRAALRLEVERLHAKILAEPAGLMPETFTAKDLDHLALKIALHFLEDMPPGERMTPAQVAAVVRAEILEFVPAHCLARFPLPEPAMFGTPERQPFRHTIPRDFIRTAIKKAGYLRLLE